MNIVALVLMIKLRLAISAATMVCAKWPAMAVPPPSVTILPL